MMRRHQRVIQNVLLPIAVSLSLFLLHHFQFVNFHELGAVDLRMRLRGNRPAHADILLVEIDDKSLEELGPRPWPRALHARLISILEKYQPRFIVYDVLFAEPGPSVNEDQALALAMEKSANVILPFYYYSETPFKAFYTARLFRESARATGYVNLEPDWDGKIRRVKAFLKTAEETYYHVSVLAVMAQFVDEERAAQWLNTIPRDSENRFAIHYPGSLESFQRVSSSDIIEARGTEQEPELRRLIANRVVVIGETATGSTDTKPIAFSAYYPGMAIHAAAISTLLSGDYLRPVSSQVHLILLLALTVGVAWMAKFFGPSKSFLWTISMVAGYGGINILIFHLSGWVLPLFVPIAAMIITYTLWFFMEYVTVTFEGQLLGQELNTAARIQETFLPQQTPHFEKLDVAFHCRFAEQVGGDLYDWSDFGNGIYGVCVGDVSGKGIPAALYMARAISDFRREVRVELGPSQVFDTLNRILAHGGVPGMFLTMTYALIDTKNKKFSYCNAAQEPLVLYRESKKDAAIVTGKRNPPIGVFTDATYEFDESPIGEGDMLVFLSDGVKELRNRKGQEFGMEKIRSYVGRNAYDFSANEMVVGLFDEMEKYMGGRSARDDRTLLCVKFGTRF
ncbi:MAG: CHASE2 domain-containing protein [Candidatus Omnitrophota bacterium]|nr:CHASE2 domain-containing protein [Candidatus Omnitrophota bacterium]